MGAVRRRAGLLACSALVALVALVGGLSATSAARGARATAPGSGHVGAVTASRRALTARPMQRSAFIARAPAGAPLALVIPLVADDTGLRRFALAVSTTGSPLYGHFLSLPVLARRFGAPPAHAAAVVRYLRAAGARSIQVSPTAMFVQATMTVARAQRAFATSLAVLRASNGERFLGPMARGAGTPSASVPLPRALRGLATAVIGLDTETVARSPQPASLSQGSRAARRGGLAVLRRGRPAHDAADSPSTAYDPRSGTPSGCGGALSTGGFTPNQYLTAYGYDRLQAAGLRGGGERVALIEIDGFKHSDITTFDRCFGLHTPAIRTFTLGFRHALPAGGETTLDLELLSAAAPRLRSIDVYESQGDAAQVLGAFAAPLAQPGSKPDVVSASLGICEPFLYDALGSPGIVSIERDVELAAATGITVLASAGDDGSSACQNSDGSIVPELAVSYPASSVFVTGVGGTNFVLDSSNHIVDQLVWNDGAVHPAAGGGGYSALFDRPPYQQSVVGVNARVVPDVSMLADLAPGYAIYCTAAADDTCNGWGAVGGTSAASPLLAGGLALVDQDLHRHHRRVLGLVNPLLYTLAGSAQGGQIFSGVTQYDNDLGPYIGSDQPLGCCSAGPGFNPAAGWGSVNLAALDRAALRTAPPAPDLTLTLPRGQHPLIAKVLLARLGCSTACRANVSGDVVLSNSSEFAIQSALRIFHRRGSATIRLPLNARQLRRIRTALAAHNQVYAEVFGVALDSRGNALAVTSGVVWGF